MKHGTVKVYDIDLDCETMTSMSFWNKFCPPNTTVTQVIFSYDPGDPYAENATFYCYVDWISNSEVENE